MITPYFHFEGGHWLQFWSIEFGWNNIRKHIREIPTIFFSGWKKKLQNVCVRSDAVCAIQRSDWLWEDYHQPKGEIIFAEKSIFNILRKQTVQEGLKYEEEF